MSKRSEQLRALRTELAQERSRQAARDFTVEHLTNGHIKQQEAIREVLEPGRYRGAWMTPRRVGKTTAASYALGLLAVREQNWNLNYIGLSKDHAREVILEESFLPLLDKYQIPVRKVAQEIHFKDTDSTVRFFGTDDEQHIKKNLGKRIDAVVVDECQDQPYLKKLREKILAPALQDSGQSKELLIGTRPESKAHYFWKLYRSGKLKTRTWTPRDNPHLADFEGELRQFLEENSLSIDHPLIQSDWLGNLDVWDEHKTPFGYRESHNRHDLQPASWLTDPNIIPPGRMRACNPPPGLEWYGIGIDPGSGDRWAVVLWGWNRTRCYQIAEWVTDKGSNLTTWDPIKGVLDLWHKHYSPIVKVYRDAGSTKDTTELFGKFMRRYVLAAAKKTDRRAQVERFATYLQRSTILVIPESALEKDLTDARWSAKDLEQGKYEWDDSAIHPDVADAARYGLQGYFEIVPDQPRKILTPAEYERRDAEDAFLKMFNNSGQIPVKKERDSSSVWKKPEGSW